MRKDAKMKKWKMTKKQMRKHEKKWKKWKWKKGPSLLSAIVGGNGMPFHLSFNLPCSALCIFSPNSTLLRCHNLLVVRFPQVLFLKPGAHGFRSWSSPFWIIPTDCPFPEFCFVPGAFQEFHGVSRRSDQSHFSSFHQNRIHWIWVLRYTTLDSFLQNRNCSLSTFFSRPRAEVTSHHQHVDMGNECHRCIYFQTCNYDTRDDADNYKTMFWILPTIDKRFSALVAGLDLGRIELFTSVCPFTFGTEEDACSGWDLLCVSHFFPHCLTAHRGTLV